MDLSTGIIIMNPVINSISVSFPHKKLQWSTKRRHVLPSPSSTTPPTLTLQGVWQCTLTHVTTHWKNVALVCCSCILYLWDDGSLQLVSKAPPLHQGTLLGATVTADAYPIQIVHGGHSSAALQACWRRFMRQQAPLRIYNFKETLSSQKHWDQRITESLRNISKNNNKISPRKACQPQHFANTTVVTSAWPEYDSLSVDSLPRRVLEIWACESNGCCWHWTDDKGCLGIQREQQALNGWQRHAQSVD